MGKLREILRDNFKPVASTSETSFDASVSPVPRKPRGGRVAAGIAAFPLLTGIGASVAETSLSHEAPSQETAIVLQVPEPSIDGPQQLVTVGPNFQRAAYATSNVTEPAPPPEVHTAPHEVHAGETLGKIVKTRMRANIEKPTRAQVNAGIAAEKVVAGLSDADKIRDGQTIPVLDTETFGKFGAAVEGKNPDGSSASPKVKADGAALRKAVTQGEGAYDTLQAAQATKVLLADFNLDIPDVPSEPSQNLQPVPNPEPMTDTEFKVDIAVLTTAGAVQNDTLQENHLWGEANAAGLTSNADANVDSRTSKQLIIHNPDNAISKNGHFSEFTMHTGEPIAHFDRELSKPLFDNINKLTPADMLVLKHQLHEKHLDSVYTALYQLWAINNIVSTKDDPVERQREIDQRDKDGTMRTALILTYIKVHHLEDKFNEVMDLLGNKSGRDLPQIITTNADLQNILATTGTITPPAPPEVPIPRGPITPQPSESTPPSSPQESSTPTASLTESAPIEPSVTLSPSPSAAPTSTPEAPSAEPSEPTDNTIPALIALAAAGSVVLATGAYAWNERRKQQAQTPVPTQESKTEPYALLERLLRRRKQKDIVTAERQRQLAEEAERLRQNPMTFEELDKFNKQDPKTIPPNAFRSTNIEEIRYLYNLLENDSEVVNQNIHAMESQDDSMPLVPHAKVYVLAYIEELDSETNAPVYFAFPYIASWQISKKRLISKISSALRRKK